MSRDRICWIIDKGLVPYREAYELQNWLVSLRLRNLVPDCLILLEHPPVLTLGRRRGAENILVSKNILTKEKIEVISTDRGGNVTYHGPGQLVGYPILNLRDHCGNVSEYLRKIEKVIILTLKDFEVKAKRRSQYPGVWVGEKKIASIGVAIKRFRITYHGFAFNINPDTSFFKLIHPCGIKNLEVTSLAHLLGYPPEMAEIKQKIARSFARTFRVKMLGNGAHPPIMSMFT
jgi:lipoate-protein ligase B